MSFFHLHLTGDEDEQALFSLVCIFPITEIPGSLLVVAYRGEGPGRLSWKLEESGRAGVIDLVLERKGDNFSPLRAVYRWSPEKKRYEGPPGAEDGDFLLLLEGHDSEALDRFANRSPGGQSAGRPPREP